jgi:wyosine [tRNA(Phe)-imidazoG37] synthetase (radical SAM superfamily)
MLLSHACMQINGLVGELHSRGISTFLVTNAQVGW